MQIETNKYLNLFAVIVTVIAYWINTNSLSSIAMVIAVSGILLSLFNITKGCQYFFIMALAFSDYTFGSVMGEDPEMANLGGVYMAKVGPATIMAYWAFINLILILLKKSGRAKSLFKVNPVLKLLVVIIFFSLIGFFFNVLSGGNSVVRTAVSDASLYLNIIVGFLTLILIVKNDWELKKYFNIFLLTLITNIILTLISSYFTSQTQIIYTFFSGTETYFNGVLLIFLLLLLKKRKQNDDTHVPLFFVIGGLVLLMLFLFVVPSRGRLLGIGFAVFIYLIYSRKWWLLGGIPIMLFSGIYLVQLINPNFFDYFMWKISTMNPTAEGADSSGTRLVEAANIFGEIFSNPYYLIFGKGFGGFFTTEFMDFSGITIGSSAYRPEWLSEGKFYKPHGTWLQLFLKAGFVMTCLFYYHIAKIFMKGVKQFRSKIQSYNWVILLSFAIPLPYLSIVIFSSKLQLLFGFALGFSFLAVKFLKKEQSTITPQSI